MHYLIYVFAAMLLASGLFVLAIGMGNAAAAISV